MKDPKRPFGYAVTPPTMVDPKVAWINAYMAGRPFAHDDAQASDDFRALLTLTTLVTPIEMLQQEVQDAAGIYIGLMAARAVVLAARERMADFSHAADRLLPKVLARVQTGDFVPESVPSAPAVTGASDFLAASGLKPYVDGALEMFGRDGVKNILQTGGGIEEDDINRFMAEVFGQAATGGVVMPQHPSFSCTAFAAGLAAFGLVLPAPVAEVVSRTRLDGTFVPFDALMADGDILGMMVDDAAAYLHRVKTHIKVAAPSTPQDGPVVRVMHIL